MTRYLAVAIVAALGLLMTSSPENVSAQASTSLFISEVHPGGSGNGTYNADWFEVTNAGFTTVNISGWKVDDSSNAFATAVPLSGVTSIAPGQSVVFIDASAPVDVNAFSAAWFGGQRSEQPDHRHLRRLRDRAEHGRRCGQSLRCRRQPDHRHQLRLGHGERHLRQRSAASARPRSRCRWPRR